MVYFQQSLFGKTSWERFHQMTGWILEPSYPLSQTPMFQCLLLEDGQEPEWCEGERLTSAGGSWTPSIGQAPDWHDGSASFLWQTLEDGVPTKYFLSPAQCSHFLHLAEIAGYDIARILFDDKIDTPAVYFGKQNKGVWKSKEEFPNPYNWSGYIVGQILSKPEYMGHTVNFRSHKQS